MYCPTESSSNATNSQTVSDMRHNPLYIGSEAEHSILGLGDMKERQQFAAGLLVSFKSIFGALDDRSGNGCFSPVGRFYLDGIAHPEYCTPEVTDLESLIYYKLLFDLFVKESTEQLSHHRMSLYKNSGCYLSGTSWGEHENYSLSIPGISGIMGAAPAAMIRPS